MFIPSDRLSKKENFLHEFGLRVFGKGYAFVERQKEVVIEAFLEGFDHASREKQSTKFFRQLFHEYAAESIRHSFWARAYYGLRRSKGKEHHAAVRALAFKWIRIIWKCWQTRTPYNEVVYLESLRKKTSSLLNFAANNPT